MEYYQKEFQAYKGLFSLLHYVSREGTKSENHIHIESYEQTGTFPNVAHLLDFFPSKIGPVSKTFFELLYNNQMTPNLVKRNQDGSFSLTKLGRQSLDIYSEIFRNTEQYVVYKLQLADLKKIYQRLNAEDIVVAIYYKYPTTLDATTGRSLYANKEYRVKILGSLCHKGYIDKETYLQLIEIP